MTPNQIPGETLDAGDTGLITPGLAGGTSPKGSARLFYKPRVRKVLLPTALTLLRMNAQHNRRWHDAPANDHFDPDAYFARIGAALAWSMMGED